MLQCLLSFEMMPFSLLLFLLIDYLHMYLTMPLLLPHSSVLILPIRSCARLVVPVGCIFTHIKLTNFLSDPRNACFLTIALTTRGLTKHLLCLLLVRLPV
jgi:hypothetical protein